MAGVALVGDGSEEEALEWSWSIEHNNPILIWTVKGAQKVLLHVFYRADEGQSEFEVIIDNPTVAEAFQDHFDEIWRVISPRNYDRDYVIGWLEMLIREIRLDNPAPSARPKPVKERGRAALPC